MNKIPAFDSGTATCFDVLDGFSQSNEGNSLVANSSFYAEKNGTHTLQYRTQIPAFNAGCGKYLWAKGSFNFNASNIVIPTRKKVKYGRLYGRI